MVCFSCIRAWVLTQPGFKLSSFIYQCILIQSAVNQGLYVLLGLRNQLF